MKIDLNELTVPDFTTQDDVDMILEDVILNFKPQTTRENAIGMLNRFPWSPSNYPTI